jgi:hypothetical protein
MSKKRPKAAKASEQRLEIPAGPHPLVPLTAAQARDLARVVKTLQAHPADVRDRLLREVAEQFAGVFMPRHQYMLALMSLAMKAGEHAKLAPRANCVAVKKQRRQNRLAAIAIALDQQMTEDQVVEHMRLNHRKLIQIGPDGSGKTIKHETLVREIRSIRRRQNCNSAAELQ